MRFEKIWIEQCRATRVIKRPFRVRDALDYLVGEKLRMFAGAPPGTTPRSPASCRDSSPRFGECSTSTNSPRRMSAGCSCLAS
jgi:hypothetical protein